MRRKEENKNYTNVSKKTFNNENNGYTNNNSDQNQTRVKKFYQFRSSKLGQNDNKSEEILENSQVRDDLNGQGGPPRGGPQGA